MFLLFPAIVLSAPSPRAGHILHEKRAAEPVDWVLARRAEPSRILPLRIGLTQSNVDKLEEMLMDVSHPESPNYGKHKTPEEIIEIFAPSNSTIEAVLSWLEDSGFSGDRLALTINKGWIEVKDATVAEVEDLLNTEYHIYEHESGVQQIGM